MAVQTTTNRISYTGNGTTTVFAYNFRILSADHLKVYISGELKTFGVDYGLTGVGDAAGGSVSFSAAPANGTSVVLVRQVPINQLISTENNETIFSQVFDDAIDKLTMIAQQLQSTTTRAVYLSDQDPTTAAMTLPFLSARANKYLRFDANGLPTAVDSQIDAQYSGGLTSDPSTRVDGSPLKSGDLYYNTVTGFFRVYNGTAWGNAIAPASLALVNYSEKASTAKTTFTVSGGYTPGSVFVYLNGVLLQPTEYTASNGSTVVLVSACAIDDEFRCVGFSSFSVANALAMSANLSDVASPSAARTNLGLGALATLAAVGTAQISDSSITTAKIADAAVTGGKLADANLSAAKLNGAQSGSAPIYAARAWVSFDGSTTTPTINGSGNVSSITDNGTGDYTLNFTTAMPNANYSYAGCCTRGNYGIVCRNAASPTTTTLRLNTLFQNSGSPVLFDPSQVTVIVMG